MTDCSVSIIIIRTDRKYVNLFFVFRNLHRRIRNLMIFDRIVKEPYPVD